jgi:hypothetical protein
METPADWPFEAPPNVAVITSRAIVAGEEWIAFVSHDEGDGGWQFHGPEPIGVDEAVVVALRSILAKDGSIAALADLPEGWQAWRDGPDAAWQRAPND